MVPYDPLQQLLGLNKASPQFHDQLRDFLRGDAYRNAWPNLQSENLTSLVEYLDSVLVGISDRAIPVFQESLHELRKICGAKEVFPKSWTLSESLLGCVYKGSFNGSNVRIRRVRVHPGEDPQKVKETFHKVAVISKRSAHPNIVPLLGVTMEPLELISAWMPGGDLPGYIAMNPDANILSLLSDVAEGLHFLHSCDLIHGDLKGSSILVDATDHARITDFGLAMVTQDPGPIDRNARWIAPEIMEGRGTYSKEADIFSFAGVAIEAFTGATPFGGKSSHAARLAVIGGERPQRPSHPTLTDGVWKLIQRCWDREAHLRPGALMASCGFSIPPWKSLVDRPLTADERRSLIADVFSDHDTEVDRCLRGDEAQSFVDVIDKALDSLESPLRQALLKTLCKKWGHRAPLPRSLQIKLDYDRSSTPLCNGGFAGVWKVEYRGTTVAVKALRISRSSHLEKIKRNFFKEVMVWKNLHHQNVLPLLGAEMDDQHFEMISEWMDNGNINEFIKKNGSESRFELLKGVARGLIYLHGHAVIHGDLKGANILIDRNHHARLADFGLLTFARDPTNPTASISTASTCGTTRWMSPELLDPERFGFKDSRPTKQSDCYALGMVILEVLSGRPPFALCQNLAVMLKVVNCEHPEKPQEVQSADIWETLEQCWSFQPRERPTSEVILECLERVSPTTTTNPLEQVQQHFIGYPLSQGELPSLHETILGNREDKNPTGRVGGSGVPSSYWTTASHPTEKLDQENFPEMVPGAHLQRDPAEPVDPDSRNYGGSFPGVTVQTGDYSGTDSNKSSAIDGDGPALCDELQVALPLQRVFPDFLPASMSHLMVTDNCIETLLHLDRSSSQFPDKLSDILARTDFGESIQSLETNDLLSIIEYLDKALGDVSPVGLAFGRAHRKLQKICVTRMLLPSSHILLNDTLTIDERPFASSNSDVHKGRYYDRQVCIKKLRVASANDLEKTKKLLFREALLWKRLIHPNIVPFVGVTADPPQIASDLMPYGNLTTYIKSNPQQDRVSLLVGVAKGLDYLHSYGVIHGDLKGPNILVDGSGRARITDFGLAQDTLRVVTKPERQNMRWTAPEALAETGTPSTEADVFSFGMVMVESFTGMVPFSDRNSPAAMTAIMRGKRPPRPAHSSLTDRLWGLMNRCWDEDRHNRPRMLEVLLTFNPLIHELLDIRQRLENLDPSNEEYRPLIYALLTHRDLEPHINSLRKGDLQGFVELLNKALNHIPVTDDLFRKTLRRLQSTCGNCEVLPRSCLLLGGTLSNRGILSAAGGTADAHEAKFNGKTVCIKTLGPYVQSKTFYREVVVWKRLKHPNIVPFLGVLVNTPPLIEIVHDWMENGMVTDYVRKQPRLDRFGVLWDVAEGLHYLHLDNVIHGDLKGANVLIDTAGHARLTDFGLTSIVLGNKSTISFQDAHPAMATTWAAPEISDGGFVTREGDVFAFAMVAVETFTEHSLSIKCYTSLLTGRHPQRPATLSHDLWNLMQGCWNLDPRKRPTTFELVDFFRPSFWRERETSETQTFSSALSDETLEYPESGNTGSHSDISAVEAGAGGDGIPKVSEGPGPSRSNGRGLFSGGKRVTPTRDHESSTPTHKTNLRRRLTRFGSGSS